MAQRVVAVSDGKYIGIESIFTVIDGKQINIPEKLKELREKSHNNELFCPCGCGANLVLVAGDKNLREQHFRIKDGQQFEKCTVTTEGKLSVDSKIVLKCWLDDNLHVDDLESRVPICDISDSNRRYEFTFISKKMGIALDYCYNRANLSDEKQSILEQNGKGVKIIHIVDYMNGGTDGQYPEGLMKVQEKQELCLLLEVKDADYETAEMKAVFYDQNINGFWQEIIFADGRLPEYRINQNGEVYFHGASLLGSLKDARLRLQESKDIELKRREEERIRWSERLKQQELEAEKRREEQRKQLEALAEIQRAQEETARRRAKQEDEQRIAKEKAVKEKQEREENFNKNLASNFTQQETQVLDADGNRWIKCEFCKKIAMESEFSSYGGTGRINLGICKECSVNNPEAKIYYEKLRQSNKNKHDSNICPICRGNLVEKSGRNGRFIGCSSFPKCHYSRSIRK